MFLKYHEVFTSIQGEGIGVGELVTFIRLAGCNLRCFFCDTKFSWKTAGVEISLDALVSCIKEKHIIRDVAITGGEPLLQQREILILAEKLFESGTQRLTIETNGSVEIWDAQWNRFDNVLFSFSPKHSFFDDEQLKETFYSNLKRVKNHQVKILVNVVAGKGYLSHLKSEILHLPVPTDVIVQPIATGEDSKAEQHKLMTYLLKGVLGNTAIWAGVPFRSLRFIGQFHKLFGLL